MTDDDVDNDDDNSYVDNSDDDDSDDDVNYVAYNDNHNFAKYRVKMIKQTNNFAAKCSSYVQIAVDRQIYRLPWTDGYRPNSELLKLGQSPEQLFELLAR